MTEAAPQRFALSPEQRDAWLRYGDARIGGEVTIVGACDRDRLDEALRALVAEHEILRTRFEQVEGFDLPLQVIDPPPASRLEWDIRRVDADRHRIELRTSCLNADAATFGHLAQAIARRVGLAAPSDPPMVQYADYAAWANDEAAAAVARENGASSAGAGVEPAGQTAIAERAGISASELDTVSCELQVEDGEIDEATALAAWVALWCAYGDQECVLVQRDGRVSSGLAFALGPFERWLPFPVTLPPNATAAEAVADVARRLDACMTQAAWPVGVAAGVGFRYEGGRAAGAWAVEAVEPPGAPCGLVLTVRRGAGGAAATLRYARAAWDGATATRLLTQYAGLVRQAARADAGPWRAWTRGAVARPAVAAPVAPVADVVTQIVAAAARWPAAAAVRVGPAALTYGELVAAAAGWGAAVAGYGAEARVGLLATPGVATVAAWVGLLGAGVTVVPLDPATPAAWLAAQVAAGALAAVVAPDGTGPGIGAPGAAGAGAWPRPVQPAQLAYVLLTSGSTGPAKGVGVPHAALGHYAASLAARLAPAAGARWTLVSPLTVDLGYTSLVGALTTGGVLEWWAGPEALAPGVVGGADYLKITPTHLTALLAAAGPGEGLPRVGLLLGGEAPSWALVTEVARRAPGLAVFNHYGPTETTIGVLLDRVEAAARPRPAAPLLGRPLGHVTTAVLDAAGDPVLPGAPGLLWVGGPSLARGYEGDPRRTAAAFQPDPAGPPGARRYATGDRVRETPDGRAQFLGRADRQLKLRGHRIDPAAIEAVLTRHPAVAQALVLPRRDALAAYLVPSGEAKPSLQALRRLLEDQLPPFMVPAHFVWVADPPRTSSGKIDPSRLPEPGTPPAEFTEPAAGPATEVERLLLDVWTSVLKVDRLGVLDNFFLVGGDSIASIQVVARASQRGLHITPRQLFDHPTIRALAAVARPVDTRATTPAVTPGAVPLTPIQQWFFDAQAPEPHHYNQAIWLDAREPLDAALLRASLDALIDHHDALRLRFVPALDGWRQVQHVERESVPLDVIDVASGREAATLAEGALRCQTALNLVRGPLFRAGLFRMPDRSDRLLLVAHHLIVDGLSWTFLLEDLQRAYLQVRAGEAVALAPRTSAFQAWAAHLATRAPGLAPSPVRDAWLAHLARPLTSSAPAAADEGLPGADPAEEDVVDQWVPADATREYLDLTARAYGLRPLEALLAALLDAWGSWSGDDTFVTEIESHGRDGGPDAPDVSRTVGWFTVRYPLRLDRRGAGPAAVLKSVKETVREAADWSAAYGLLRYLVRDPAFEALPAASVSVNYFGQVDRTFPAGSPFVAFSEEHATSRARSTPRRFRLDVNMAIEQERLHVHWRFGSPRDSREAVGRLATQFAEAIARLTAHCRQPEAGGFTPSDFPAAGLSQNDLDRLLADWSRDFS